MEEANDRIMQANDSRISFGTRWQSLPFLLFTLLRQQAYDVPSFEWLSHLVETASANRGGEIGYPKFR
jgi:hypothetical protein